jgi:hypothetical protein
MCAQIGLRRKSMENVHLVQIRVLNEECVVAHFSDGRAVSIKSSKIKELAFASGIEIVSLPGLPN